MKKEALGLLVEKIELLEYESKADGNRKPYKALKEARQGKGRQKVFLALYRFVSLVWASMDLQDIL